MDSFEGVEFAAVEPEVAGTRPEVEATGETVSVAPPSPAGGHAAPSGINRVEIDGVPVFWVESDGPCVAGLTFRVGQSDERAVTSGITHLVEHLAMAALGRTQYQSNAFVDGISTSFVMRGNSSEAADFVRAICTALSDLPMARLDLEGRVLRTESQQHGASPPAHLLWLRYGNVAHGLTFIHELAFNDPNPRWVKEWARERFTRGNCVMWISGKLPDGLSFPLPDGARYPLVDPQPLAEIRFPAAMPFKAEHVGIGMEGPRTAAATTVYRILAGRLHEQVRLSRGLTYQIGYDRQTITTERAHNAIWLTSLPEQAMAVRTELLRVIEEMAVHGPTDAELADDLDMYLRHAADPDSRTGDVSAASLYELTGMPPFGPAELLAERRLVTREDCIADMAKTLPTSIVVAPDVEQSMPAGFNPLPIYSTWAVYGRAYRPANSSKPGTRALTIGTTGASITDDEGRHITVLWADCVALLVDSPTVRLLMGADGLTVKVDASFWEGGLTAIGEIDRSVPEWLHVQPAQ